MLIEITTEKLRRWDACRDGKEAFKKVFGTKATLLLDANLWQMAQDAKWNCASFDGGTCGCEEAGFVKWLIIEVASRNQNLLDELAETMDLEEGDFCIRRGIKPPKGYEAIAPAGIVDCKYLYKKEE